MDPTAARRSGLVSARRAARELGLHPTTVRRWIRDGIVPGHMIGAHIRGAARYYLTRETLDRLLATRGPGESLV